VKNEFIDIIVAVQRKRYIMLKSQRYMSLFPVRIHWKAIE